MGQVYKWRSCVGTEQLQVCLLLTLVIMGVCLGAGLLLPSIRETILHVSPAKGKIRTQNSNLVSTACVLPSHHCKAEIA